MKKLREKLAEEIRKLPRTHIHIPIDNKKGNSATLVNFEDVMNIVRGYEINLTSR